MVHVSEECDLGTFGIVKRSLNSKTDRADHNQQQDDVTKPAVVGQEVTGLAVLAIGSEHKERAAVEQSRCIFNRNGFHGLERLVQRHALAVQLIMQKSSDCVYFCVVSVVILESLRESNRVFVLRVWQALGRVWCLLLGWATGCDCLRVSFL